MKVNADPILEGIDGDAVDMTCPKQPADEHSKLLSSSSRKNIYDWDLDLFKSYNLVSVTSSMNRVKDPLPSKHLPLLGHGKGSASSRHFGSKGHYNPR